MRIDGKTLPNNPMKAYQQGKLMGTKQNMDLVSEVLFTKFGFHVLEETPDSHDTMSVEYTGNLLTKSGSVVVTVTTTDSRGRNKTVTNTITVQQYAGPSIANLTYARGSYTGGVWTENNTGADIKVMFDLTISLSNNTASISLKIDDENRQTLSAQSSGSKVVYIAGVGTDTTRKLTVVATDAFSSSFTKEMDVATVEVPLNINFNLPGACFGGVAEKGKTVQFKWPIYAENTVELNGELILSDSAAGKLRQAMGIQDYIIEQGVSGNWTYYKYASGYADLWWRGTVTPTSYTTFGSAAYTNTISLSMPFGVTGNVVITGSASDLHTICNTDWSYASKTLSFRMARGASMTPTNETVSLRVTGKWKA